MAEIIPAILSKNLGDYHKKFKAIEPLTEWIQVDIVDNKFAPNSTIGPKEIASFRTTKKFEIHLMVDFIEDWVDPFVKLGVARIIIPVETSHDPLATILHLKRHGIEVGFGLNPETPVVSLQHLLDKIDSVLLLSVHPGFSGQHFVHTVLDKIHQVKATRPDIRVEVDGGIEPGIARKCAQAGADILVSGGFIFENDTIEGGSYNEKVEKALQLLKADVTGL